jgi:nucleoside diphosphate kinase
VNAKDKGAMPDDEKSTDPGLSAAERKALRVREAQEAIADHEEAQTTFHENRERLRKERLVREATKGPMLAPTPELPDDTPIERVLFSTRIQNALRAETSDNFPSAARGLGARSITQSAMHGSSSEGSISTR